MTKRCASLLFLVSSTVAFASGAHAERLVPAYDPKLHVRPPTMKSIDGGAAELVMDQDFIDEAARFMATQPPRQALTAADQIGLIGEVIVLQGNTTDILVTNGTRYGLGSRGLQAVASKVIEKYGDDFHAITIWMTFEDANNPSAEAYEVPVRNEVSGLGKLPVGDASAAYGSAGTLRSILNMKTVGLAAGDSQAGWNTHLETWGQESSHRWMVFMPFRDPRSGRVSEALLGRQCAHYSRYVDTQGSIHDGYAWADNGDGTFTWSDKTKRYGNLDLYGMGLMAADEVPPFFFIDGIAGYTYPPACSQYVFTFRDPPRTVTGTRVDVTIADLIAVNGERKVPTGERQDYWREAEVILTSPVETPQDRRVQELAARIDRARLWWEDWNRTASGNRLVMCTKVSEDCGDPRSDVGQVTFNAAGKGPASGPLGLDVEVVNTGGRAATGIKVGFEAKFGEETRAETKMLGTLEPGAKRVQKFAVDMKTVPCGTEIQLKAFSHSDFHYHRSLSTFLMGVQERITDGFEEDSGWTADPDGDDSATGATWERGMPERSEVLHAEVQPGSVHGGSGAWVTGLAATSATPRAALVREGKATLQSPLYETKGLLEPILRYWVSFAGVRAGGGGTLEASPESKLLVEARGLDANGGTPTDWEPIDGIDNQIAPTWVQRSVPLPKDLLKKPRLQLRFVAHDANLEQGGVEAAIDDLVITSNLTTCNEAAPQGAGGSGGNPMAPPGGGCNCHLGGSAPGGTPAAAIALAVFGLLLRRRLLRRQ